MGTSTASRDAVWEKKNVPLQLKPISRVKSVISKGNILGYYRNLGSLRYGNEYCVPGRAMNCMPRLLPSKKSELRWLEQIKSNHFYCHITTAQVPW